MAMELRFISVDEHVQEHPGVWTQRLSRAKWGERIPHVAKNAAGEERWLIDGREISLDGVADCGALLAERSANPQRWADVPAAVYDPQERLTAMDAAGIDMLHVPYKTSAMPDLMSGQVNIGFEPPGSAIPLIKTGKVRAIAYTGNKRNSGFPDLPALGEMYPGLEISSSLSFFVPAGTPGAIVTRLHAELSKATQTPEVNKRILDNGLEPAFLSPEEAAASLRREAELMGRIIKAKGIKID